MDIQLLSDTTIDPIIELTLALWPECDYDEEKNQWKQFMYSPDHYCALAKVEHAYIGFIHISIRYDYVEGAESNKTAYLEGIYVKPDYRKNQIASALLSSGEKWAISNGLTEIASDTEINNQISQLFHQQAGFKEVNRLVCYIKKIHS
ncbi:GNAT family N-acetyltransferase [Sediminibacterium sp. KACHI17]|jgi:aminoglycoside 6'-N-acetyltransferase I|uniref:Aminoglycoside N(6')-acetyltransferase type 1 n=1 Tax=Sediminibacterium sp. KACHI17 TaxID=1751071 RepID=A0AAT9GJE6_9BACT